MCRRRAWRSAVGVIVAVAMVAHTDIADAEEGAKFKDPLDTPAERIEGAAVLERQPLLAVTRAGRRLIAVGLRGLVIISDDRGHTWRQAAVPAQSDLVSVSFVTPSRGWAVGHEGVILKSEDGGDTWAKQLDGRISLAKLAAYYQRRIDAGEGRLGSFLNQVKLNTQSGPSLPYMDVLFEDERSGWVVGPFGMILHTEDAGQTWIPWLDHVENDHFLNLNAIAKIGKEVYIAGEGGMVYVLDRKAARFVARPTGYKGSFFGIVGTNEAVVAFGLRGTVFRSADAGGSWTHVATDLGTNLTGGTVIDSKTLALVSDGGLAIQSEDEGRTFRALPTETPMLFTGAAEVEGGRAVLVGIQGVARAAPRGDTERR